MLQEPAHTAYDLHFELLGISVRVHPMFWLMGLVLSGMHDPLDTMVWIAAVFVSILIHELGHAVTMRRQGIRSHIVLYLMGGLAIPDGSFGMGRVGPRERVLIYFAGPAAGFVLAAVVVAVLVGWGGSVWWHPDQSLWPRLVFPAAWEQQPQLANLAVILLAINIVWGVVNLLPVFPLDGGQIAREYFVANDPWRGQARAFWVSMVVAGGVALLALPTGQLFVMVLFGSLAFQNYQWLQQMTGGGSGGGSRW